MYTFLLQHTELHRNLVAWGGWGVPVEAALRNRVFNDGFFVNKNKSLRSLLLAEQADCIWV